MSLHIVILAAGQGTRMYSGCPKVLHPLAGMPILERILQTVQKLDPECIHVVYGNGDDLLPKTLANYPVRWCHQDVRSGTAHALAQALPAIPDEASVLVLVGDIPLISAETLTKLIQITTENQFGLITAFLADPIGMGRILRDAAGEVVGIVEEKDATNTQRTIHEVNTGIILSTARQFKTIIPMLDNHNAKGEYYLTDAINIAARAKQKISIVKADEPEEVMGVNDRCQLEYLERYYQQKIARSLMQNGVTISDASRFDMRGQWEIGQDVKIDVDVIFEGDGVIGSGCKIGPFSLLKNVKLGKRVEVRSHSVIENAVIANDCVIGPFARIRPGTTLAQATHVGNFVEIKNSEIGEKSKINHLSYIGDTAMGSHVNVGAGTITCNYDGVNKYRTIIKDGVFIGSDTQLIAPVTVGKGATIAAGTTVTKDIPDQTLIRNQLDQVSIEGWQRKEKEQEK